MLNLAYFSVYCLSMATFFEAAQILQYGPRYSVSQIYPSTHNFGQREYSKVISRGEFAAFAGPGGLQLLHRMLFHSYEYSALDCKFQKVVPADVVVRNLGRRLPSLSTSDIENRLLHTEVFMFALLPGSGAIYPYQSFIARGLNTPFYKCHVAETSFMRAIELLMLTWRTPLNNGTLGLFSYVVCAYTKPNEVHQPLYESIDSGALEIPEVVEDQQVQVDRLIVGDGLEYQEITEAIVIRSKNSVQPHSENGLLKWTSEKMTITISTECLEIDTSDVLYRFTAPDGGALLSIKNVGQLGHIIHLTTDAGSFSYNLQDHKPGNYVCVLASFSNQDANSSLGKVDALLDLLRGDNVRFNDFQEEDWIACVKTANHFLLE